jgi:2-dehydro-3-deoxyglucarate aldolase/4-hydroxy-2-oxoheptanedioate aldolase
MATLREQLARGELVRMFGLGQLFSPKLVQVVGEHGGFEALWLDREHGGLTMRDVELAAMAAKPYGMDPIVRLPATDYATVMQVLEAGAGGIIVSMVRSAAEAEQAVQWAKFAPRGRRGLNGSNRDGRFGLDPLPEYVARANASTFVGVQIETAEALAEVEAVAAVPDVDLLFVGPVDLSQVLGVTGQFEHPLCLEAIGRIASACRAEGKAWGVVPQGPDHAARMLEMGCRLFTYAFDIRSIHEGIRALKQKYGMLNPPATGG